MQIHPLLGWKVNFNNVSRMYNGLQARIFSSPRCYGSLQWDSTDGCYHLETSGINPRARGERRIRSWHNNTADPSIYKTTGVSNGISTTGLYSRLNAVVIVEIAAATENNVVVATYYTRVKRISRLHRIIFLARRFCRCPNQNFRSQFSNIHPRFKRSNFSSNQNSI